MRNSNISSPSLEKVVVGAVCLGRDWLGLTIQSIYMSPGYIRHFNRERGKGHTKLQLVFFLSFHLDLIGTQVEKLEVVQ